MATTPPAATVAQWAEVNNIGVAYAGLGDREQALGCYRQALPILREVGNRVGEAATLTSIGVAYAGLGDQVTRPARSCGPKHRRGGPPLRSPSWTSTRAARPGASRSSCLSRSWRA